MSQYFIQMIRVINKCRPDVSWSGFIEVYRKSNSFILSLWRKHYHIKYLGLRMSTAEGSRWIF